MSNNKNTTHSGIGFFGVLTIAFIVLKLTHYIDWSWIWVLSPLWIPLVPVLLVTIIVYIVEFFTSKRYICLFKGHQYENTHEVVDLSYSITNRPVTRCTRCGKKKQYVK